MCVDLTRMYEFLVGLADAAVGEVTERPFAFFGGGGVGFGGLRLDEQDAACLVVDDLGEAVGCAA